MNKLIGNQDYLGIGTVLIFSSECSTSKLPLKIIINQNFKFIIERYDNFIQKNTMRIINIIKSSKPNLIIIDNYRKTVGVEFYEFLKKVNLIGSVPVIFVGIKDESDIMNSIKLGALDYIDRSIPDAEFIYKIKNFIKLVSSEFMDVNIDKVTGVYRKSIGEEFCKKFFEISISEKRYFTIMALEFDSISSMIKPYGIPFCNEILNKCLKILRGFTVIKDIIYRFDSYKFILAFIDKRVSEVLELSDQMQEAINSLGNRLNIELSFTAGISSINDDSIDFNTTLNLSLETLDNGKTESVGKTYIEANSIESKREKSILILDEDTILLNILNLRYTNKGFEVYTANTSEEAFSLIERKNFDVIITEALVGDINLDDIIATLKNLKKRIKVLVLTSQKGEKSIISALSSGADDYISKPFSPIELDMRIQKLLK